MPENQQPARHTTLSECRQRDHVLTLGELEQLFARYPDLPKDTPIVYQRIEDSYLQSDYDNGWRVVPLPWESMPYDAELETFARDKNIPYHVFEHKGEKRIMQYSEFIPGWGAYVVEDVEGHKAICIHSHY